MGDSRPSAPPPAASPLLAACPTCRAVFRGGFQRCPNDGSRLQAGPDDPLVGTVLAGRYQIEAVIGDGGIGRVYRARHVRMSRRFAIKVPFGELAYDRKVRARFANEADAASRLSHPNVIGVVDVGETPEGLFYLAMDLADGTALCDVIARGALDERRATTIFAQIADGLAHAHDRGLIHRDLKPDNVILARGGDGGEQARIVDFGLAIVGHERAGSRLTTEGVVLGTPHYMAPEQATDEDIDYRADLFALGLILFEMLAGCLPFDGTAVEVARQNLGRELPTVAARAQRPVDPLLEGLVRWLTRKQAHERPERTAQVAEIARMLLRGDRDAAAACIPGALPPPAEVELVPLDDGAAEPAEPLAPPTATATVAPAAPPLPAATLAAPPPVATRFDPPAEPRPTEQTAPAAVRRSCRPAAAAPAGRRWRRSTPRWRRSRWSRRSTPASSRWSRWSTSPTRRSRPRRPTPACASPDARRRRAGSTPACRRSPAIRARSPIRPRRSMTTPRRRPCATSTSGSASSSTPRSRPTASTPPPACAGATAPSRTSRRSARSRCAPRR
ncbi:MAG TPA: serine/threonine-protein kinase [Kofleriaceae bacterium]|nr:serine/threonine-protein kinase [Kofleriaceae bacterium]